MKVRPAPACNDTCFFYPAFLVITAPESGYEWDIIARRYRNMFTSGTDFTLFEKEMGSWSIYRLIIPDRRDRVN